MIKDIARKKNLSIKQVRQAVESQSSLVVKAMKRGKAESVRLPYWGVFEVDEYRLKKLKENTGGKGLRQLEQ